MRKISLLVCALAFTVGVNTTIAQDSTRSASDLPNGGGSAKPVWIFGIHGMVADDDGKAFSDLFNVGDSWNFLPYPSRITVERGLTPMWRLEASLAYTLYKTGKILNENPIASDQPFVAFDLNAKYDLNALFGETSVFDPYTVTGLGFTHRSAITEQNTPTVNLGLGFNIWIYKGFGLNLQSTAKFKLLPNTSNYLLHSVGIVYRINESSDGSGNGTIREVR